MINYRLERESLVELMADKGVLDKRVLDAMRNVRRHEFVPPNLRSRAYEDVPLSIGEEQTISQPFMVARMTEILKLEGHERVLEIGTGSGYQAAILAQLAQKVFTVERITALAEEAKKKFTKLGYSNIIQRVGDGTLGWKEFAPFDVIMVTAGAPNVPSRLFDQLAEGGKLVIPIGPRRIQDLKLVMKINGRQKIYSEGGCVFVPLIGTEGWKNL